MMCLLSAILTTLFWLALLGYGLRRVLTNMKNNPVAAEAVTRHVLTPLLAKADDPVVNLAAAPREENLPFAEEES